MIMIGIWAYMVFINQLGLRQESRELLCLQVG